MIIHPVYKYSFDDLLHGLNYHVGQGNITKKTKGELSLFNYTRKCQYENNFSTITESARGLIICESQKKIVALPLSKFFNYRERTYSIPKEDFITTEKLDGSLGILYFWENKWNVATRGSFDSKQSEWAEKWLHKNINLSLLNSSLTYLVEIIYRENRIVVNYPYEGLVILSAYDLRDGHEVNMCELMDLGFRCPLIYKYEFKDLLELCKTLPSSEEGFVVRFDSGYRLKIKGEEYCRAHRLISKVTPLGVWDLLRECGNIEGVRSSLPEEHLEEFDKLVIHFTQTFENNIKDLVNSHKSTKHLSDKNLGLLLQSKNNNLNQVVHKYLFNMRSGKFYKDIDRPNSKLRNSFFKMFRPKNKEDLEC